jgi:hypothetical protein
VRHARLRQCVNSIGGCNPQVCTRGGCNPLY